MEEGQSSIEVKRWACSVSNQHRKAYGDHKIRQRTGHERKGGAKERCRPADLARNCGDAGSAQP